MEQGLQEGRAEGREEGEKNAAIKFARALREEGIPIERIVKLTEIQIKNS